MSTDICFMTARELAAVIHRGDLSAREVMEAHLTQIDRINPKVNAIVSLAADQALEKAIKADKRFVSGQAVGPLHGLPIAIKDNTDVNGIPTTMGLPALRDNIPSKDALIVERLRAAGAIIIGKTNIPELSAKGHTTNRLFGTTRNPYDLSRTAGGSSGGAAAAIACGMVPLATGTDMGGSLRNPAAFNNVVGLRTTPGRVPSYPKEAAYSPLSVGGPITRNVEDASLMMSVISGPDVRAPISIVEPGSQFLRSLEIDLKGLRVAWSPDLGGTIPVDTEVRELIEKQVKVLQGLGCEVEKACPDFVKADEIFDVLRAWEFELNHKELFDRFKEEMHPSHVWNMEKAHNLRGIEISQAERLRGELYQQLRIFFEKYDVLLLPVTPIPPFDADIGYPKEIEGIQMDNYYDWLRACYSISIIGNPAMSVPAGFTSDGLPVGLQIVGKYGADFEVLQFGYMFERATRYGKQQPNIAVQ